MKYLLYLTIKKHKGDWIVSLKSPVEKVPFVVSGSKSFWRALKLTLSKYLYYLKRQ